MFTFILLIIISYFISLMYGINEMITSWKEKNREHFDDSLKYLGWALVFGFVLGYLIAAVYIKDEFNKHFDKHFNNKDK